MSQNQCCTALSLMVEMFHLAEQLDNIFLSIVNKAMPADLKEKFLNMHFRHYMKSSIAHLASTGRETLEKTNPCISCSNSRAIFLEKFENLTMQSYFNI